MNTYLKYTLSGAVLLTLGLSVISCTDQLTKANIDPNVVDPVGSNPNMIMPTIMAPTANKYLDWGWNDMAGTMQHIQHDGWFGGVNHYQWSPTDWTDYYDNLRNNEYLLKSESRFHQAIALTMRAFIFGNIADIWGDAPYTEALKGNQGITEPSYDSQEVIYKGIIEELKQAASIFSTGNNDGYLTGYDTYYGGDTQKWHKFANSLLLRYYLRISDKLPEIAKSGIEQVYATGVYITTPEEDATISFVGSVASNSWPYLYLDDDSNQSNFRRKKPAKFLMDQLLSTTDPRLKVWFAPVHVQWVADPTLPNDVDEFIRIDGKLSEIKFAEDLQLKAMVNEGKKLTRHFNPNTYSEAPLDTNRYVGIPAGLTQPDYYNGNPTPGQTVQNQHVSQFSDLYRHSSNQAYLKGRLISSSEVAFILAEAAQKGYNAGDAKSHYENAIKLSLRSWGVAEQYDDFIAREGVAYDGSLEQLITQKWVAAWTMTLEAWMDYRRTGYPKLQAGEESAQPVLPVRMIYGNNEQAFNRENITAALERIEQTKYAVQKNNQWSKTWLNQGTGKPW